MRLDDIDRKILRRLIENGRESFAALGSGSGCPRRRPSAGSTGCAASGVIRRFTAEIEPTALGWTIEAFVELYCEGRVPPDRMRELARSIPEVVEAYTVTGEADGILLVRAADAGHFEKVLGRHPQPPGRQPHPVGPRPVPPLSVAIARRVTNPAAERR